LKRYFRDYALLFFMAGIVVAIDQYTKAYVRTHLAVGEIWSPWSWLEGYFRIVHWYNSGVAFGLFQGSGQIFTVLAIIVAIIIIYYFPRVSTEDWTLRIAMGLQLGGALGNLVDRVVFGQVTDFISIGTFPVFNLADASISIGVAILILGIWIQDLKKKPENTRTTEITPSDDPPADREKLS
jgi:signal peptidase II